MRRRSTIFGPATAAAFCALMMPSVTFADSTAWLDRQARDATIRRDYPAAAALYRTAAERGDADAQYQLGSLYRLGRGVSQSRSDANYWLTRAARGGHEKAQKLLEALPDASPRRGEPAEESKAIVTDSIDTLGMPTLVSAAWRGNTAVLGELINTGADLERTDRDGLTALARATQAGRADVTHQLLDAGARPSPIDPRGETPLHHAASSGNLDIACDLLDFGAPANPHSDDGATPLLRAACNGHADMVRLLLAANTDDTPSEEIRRALECAVNAGHTSITTALLQQPGRGDLDPQLLRRLLETASEFGHVEIARILVQELPADTAPAVLSSSIIRAARSRRFDLVNEFVALGADPERTSEDGNTILMLCCAAGAHESARRLLARGATVEALNDDGNTALMLAAAGGHGTVVELLLNAGADSLRRNSSGMRADSLADRNGHRAIASQIRGSNSVKSWLISLF